MTTGTELAGDVTGLTTRNVLLRGLPPEEGALLAPRLERVGLEFGAVLTDVHAPTTAVYFPETAVASSLSVMADRGAVETATIGADGMTGIIVLLGVDASPEQTYVQVAGDALRLDVLDLRALLPQLPELHARLLRYAAALLTLIGQSSACNRKHTMVQRCARWILMTHDRVGRDHFDLTHHVLSQMLGVRRASVTEAAQVLHGAAAIEYSRGVVRVTDRAALERHACECYLIIRATSERLLGRHGVGGGSDDPLRGLRVADGGRSIAGDGGPATA